MSRRKDPAPASTLAVKILGIGSHERYALWRVVTAAQQDLLAHHPRLTFQLTEVKDALEIGRYARVLVLPTLVINDKVMCSGCFPSKKKVQQWLLQALEQSN